MILHLTPEERTIVDAILAEIVPPYEVWAFGSRAGGTPKPFSDLDLAILTQTPLPPLVRAALEDAFSESDLPWRVDIVDWASTAPDFRHVIRKQRVVIKVAA